MVWRVVRWMFSIPCRAGNLSQTFHLFGEIMPAGMRSRTIQKSGSRSVMIPPLV